MKEASENRVKQVGGTDGETPSASPRPLWATPSVLVAAVVMVVGLVVWAVNAMTGPDATADGTVGVPGGSSFMATSGQSGPDQDAAAGSESPVSPAVFRLGAGYLGGFFLGWVFRKFITLTLLSAGGLVVLLAVFQGLGWFEVNWSAVDQHLKLGLAWVHGQADSFRTFVTGYLPSAGAASAGLFVGFRKR